MAMKRVTKKKKKKVTNILFLPVKEAYYGTAGGR